MDHIEEQADRDLQYRDFQYEELYPDWMRRWNAWTRRADARIILFFREFGDLLDEAVRDISYRLDRMLFASAKDEYVRSLTGAGKGEYEYWRNHLEQQPAAAPEEAQNRSLPQDRW